MSPAAPGVPRLVLLPGLHGTAELFPPFLRALPRGVDAEVVEYPGDRPLGYDEILPLVRAALPRTGPFALVAESFGGPLAIRIAADAPPNLRAIVLCATFARNPIPSALRWTRSLARPGVTGLPLTRAFVRAFMTGSRAPAEVVDAVQEVSRRAVPAITARRLREVLDVDVRPLLPRVRVPTLYLRAAGDRLVSSRCGAGPIVAGIPGCEQIVLDGPHLLLEVRPAESIRAILEFLRRATL